MLTLLEVLDRSTAFLESRGIERARFDAELLLSHALEMDRLQLFMKFDLPLGEPELAAIREPLGRRGNGEPYAYIVEKQEFYSRDFAVGPGVLIPRPDTETLVQYALPYCQGDEVFVADIGAGTGCIGLTLALDNEGVKLFAVERSDAAAAYLKRNVEAHELTQRAAVLRGDLLSAIPTERRIDVLVSNPPYIATGELAALAVSVFEPREALDGGPDGLDVYRRLIPAAAARAQKAILVEIGHDQGESVPQLFREAGLEPEVKQDLAGRDRVVLATL